VDNASLWDRMPKGPSSPCASAAVNPGLFYISHILWLDVLRVLVENSMKGLVWFCLALFQQCEGDQKQDPCPWGLELSQGALLSRMQVAGATVAIFVSSEALGAFQSNSSRATVSGMKAGTPLSSSLAESGGSLTFH